MLRLGFWFGFLAVVHLLEAAAVDGCPPWTPPGLPPPPTNGPALCPGYFLKPEAGKAVLDYLLSVCTNRASWEAYAATVRRGILRGAGLEPLPARTPLEPVIRSRRVHDGYSVENVAFQSIPGYYVTGNLYRPLKGKAPFPAMLSPHGHGKNADIDSSPLFSEAMQQRCGTLARMGAVVFSVDMFGFGESQLVVPSTAHKSTLAMKMQLWDNTRALDFIHSLPEVDPARVGVSGASGGGTQSFLLTAVDSRVALSVPVVMVSAHFFGGCPCESGRPIHRRDEYFANNAAFAAMAAPRPMLVVSDGKDWTRNLPTVEYPFLQRVYSFYGREASVANAHLENEGHEYSPSKRLAVYRFVARHFKLDLAAALDANGSLDESHITVETPAALRFFGDSFPLPANALRGADAIEARLQELQRP